MIGCTWKDSSGNYADFVDSVGGAGHIVRIIFIGNVSFNHQIGGIYACGLQSVIQGNRLTNTIGGASASGIGYDATLAASMRSNNIVTGNNLTNIRVNNNGLSFTTNNDIVNNNQAQDSAYGGVIQGLVDVSRGAASLSLNAGDIDQTGDKILMSGLAHPRGFANVSGAPGALVAFIASIAGDKFSVRQAGNAPLSSGLEVGYIDANGKLGLVGPVALLNNVSTQGLGVPAIYQAPAPLTAQTTAAASIVTITAPNDGAKHRYRVGGFVTITTPGWSAWQQHC